VYGTRFYSLDSSVCGAARHQGVITADAPFDASYQYLQITLFGYPEIAGITAPFNYSCVASTRYGVTSQEVLTFDYVMTFHIAGSDANDVETGGFELDVPNPSSGFGRVNLLNTIALASQSVNRYVDILTVRTDDEVDDGDEMTYTVVNSDTLSVLKFTLVWSDYPGSTSADIALVNNLDLMVTTSDCTNSGDDGVMWYGNGATAGALDMLNNVEQVVILDPQECTYTIVVSGTDVPQGPQAFALVAGGSDFTQSNDMDSFDDTGEDVTGWGGPEVSSAVSVRPIESILVLALAAVVAVLL